MLTPPALLPAQTAIPAGRCSLQFPGTKRHGNMENSAEFTTFPHPNNNNFFDILIFERSILKWSCIMANTTISQFGSSSKQLDCIKKYIVFIIYYSS
jgi:hypothetical protein